MCPPSGCLTDIAVQLFVIMAVKQFIQNIWEIGVPLFHKYRKKRKLKTGSKEMDGDRVPLWQKDLLLNQPNDYVLDDCNG